MPFQEAHQAPDTVESLTLFGRRQQSDEAALVERVLALPSLRRRPFQGLEESSGVRVDAIDERAHQAQEVRPEPGHTGELSTVSYLVQCDPQAELTGLEPITVLQLDHIVAHVVDDVLVLGRLVFDQQLVVLAQDPRRHPARAGPRAGHHPCFGSTGRHPHRDWPQHRRGLGHGSLELLVRGRRSRWNDAMLARPIPVGRSPGPGPARERRPDSSVTRSSASAVSSSKSSSRTVNAPAPTTAGARLCGWRPARPSPTRSGLRGGPAPSVRDPPGAGRGITA